MFNNLINKYMDNSTKSTFAQKAIFERIRNKEEVFFVSKDYQAYEAYEDHVDSFVF